MNQVRCFNCGNICVKNGKLKRVRSDGFVRNVVIVLLIP